MIDELSGGQRQRAWAVMLLELLRGFHGEGKTIVTVLHDLKQATRYANHLIVMKSGEVGATAGGAAGSAQPGIGSTARRDGSLDAGAEG